MKFQFETKTYDPTHTSPLGCELDGTWVLPKGKLCWGANNTSGRVLNLIIHDQKSHPLGSCCAWKTFPVDKP